MDVDAFVGWALDSSRNVEERYTVELLVEECLTRWHIVHKTGQYESWETKHERNRQRHLNPAYEPRYTEESLRRATEIFPNVTSWNAPHTYDNRPVRDIKALRFLPNLQKLNLSSSEISDIAPLTELHTVQALQFASPVCEDYRALSRCKHLRELTLKFVVHWPEVAGLEQLLQLETLSLEGNLLAFDRGISWPNVRRGTLICTPLAVRSVRELPQLPACEFLTLGGVERLEGIEQFPKLRNLTLNTPVRTFAPLTALKELTSFTCNAAEPLDVSPLTKLPNLLVASFNTKHNFGIDKAKPRDFSPFVEAPQLRELRVTGCPPVETEVAGLSAGFAPWDDLFLLPQPRGLPAMRLVAAPFNKHPRRPETSRGPGESDLIDVGIREAEGKWVERFVTRLLTKRLGSKDWGNVTVNAPMRAFVVYVESFGVVERLSEIIDTMRQAIAQLRYEYTGMFMVSLKAPKRKLTKAEKELQRKFDQEQDDADFERRQKERQEYLERLHRYELKKQEGQKIKPEEFAAPSETPLPPAPWEREEEEDGNEPGGSDVITKKKPTPPPSFDDDDHPLADQYRVGGYVSLSEVWFGNRDPHMVSYLMGRNPDEIMPEEPPQ